MDRLELLQEGVVGLLRALARLLGCAGPCSSSWPARTVTPPRSRGVADPVAVAADDELKTILTGLSDREREVLSGRHGPDRPEQSLRELESALGIEMQRDLGRALAGGGLRHLVPSTFRERPPIRSRSSRKATC